MNTLIPAVLGLLLAAPALATGFDSGVDASALLAEAKAQAVNVPAPAENKIRRTVSDCRTVVFRADSGLVSPVISLRSQEWVEECHHTGGDPRRGGGGVICRERPGMVFYRDVTVSLTERKPMQPWEHDAFQVCLDGHWLNTRQLESSYKYRLLSDGGDDRIVAAPLHKTPMSPDPAGVIGELDERMGLVLADRWSRQYAGEKLVVKLELKRHVTFWPDVTVLEKELELPVAARYALDLTKYSAEFQNGLEAGKEHYVKYQIKRVGTISKPVFTKGLETAKVKYTPALAPEVALAD